jgi:hypothetical protein
MYSALAQQPILDSLLKKFDTYRTNNLTEKIYLHVDQETYLTGEVMWFKAYLVDGSLNKPTNISKVVYVEILSQENKPVAQAKVSMNQGLGSGSIFLPATLDAGYYTVRAYTNWMKNFSPEYFFHKRIAIINAFRRTEVAAPSAETKPDAQFFPEGGNMVNGIKSTVAFRVIDPFGRGIDFKGVVSNENGDTIIGFSPLRFGIGKFEMTPGDGHSYRATIVDESGRQFSYELPKAQPIGFVMHLDDTDEDEINVTINSNVSRGNGETIYLFIHARNIVTHASMYVIANGDVSVRLKKSDFQPGISHITVFDAGLQPICERLYFRPVASLATNEARPSQDEYGVRRKVTLDLHVADQSGAPLVASLSASVFRYDSLQTQDNDNIASYLWLNADLRGEIESPAFYISDSPEVAQATDNLMLTHGWRRFTWHDVLAEDKKDYAYIPEFHGHVIRGVVTDPSGNPATTVRTYLTSPSQNIQLYPAISKGNGEIKFEMKDFSGPRRIIVQTNSNLDSTSQIKILSPFFDAFIEHNYPPLILKPSHEQDILSRSVALQVQDVFYQERNSRFNKGNGDTTAFYGRPDATYLLDDYTRFPVMEEVMREYVPQVLVRKRRGKFHFMTLDDVNKAVFDEDPLVLLDGLPIFDIDKIMDFDPLLIRKLEIMTRRYYMGVVSMAGVVSYTTYTGDLAGYQLDPRAVSLDYEGLQQQREFYQPRYETERTRSTRLPDQRVLLYWSPGVITNEDGKYQIEFYTSDAPGRYKVIIQGITSDGEIGVGTTGFSVRHFEN